MFHDFISVSDTQVTIQSVFIETLEEFDSFFST